MAFNGSYPVAAPLSGSELLLAAQGPATVNIEPDQLAAYLRQSHQIGGALVYVSGTLSGGYDYLVATASSAPSLTLPALSSTTIGACIGIIDASSNAGVNNITITAAAGDLVHDHAASAGSYVVRVSNTITRLWAQAGGWLAITSGS